jgi:3-deoxy-7-phosphoheptulonate synthase
MLVVMKIGATPEQVDQVRRLAQSLGFDPGSHRVEDRAALSIVDRDEPLSPTLFETLPGVDQVLPGSRPLKRATSPRSHRTTIRAGSTLIGAGALTLIAGPCAVESEEQLLPLAGRLKRAGADLLRGGAYKPRSSPYDFQGLGEGGLRLLALARDESGLPVVTEAVDEASLELVEGYADVVQIGARNMHNYALLKRAGRSRLPVLLKRGMSARLEDLLLAAEYILDAGNPNVMLCERGIRTFSGHSRFTLDLSIIPQLRRLTHLPVLVDPSHASGMRCSVSPLARAAVAAGADGVMVEVHPDPLHALCDGHQSLRPTEFESLAEELRALEPLITRQWETVC